MGTKTLYTNGSHRVGVIPYKTRTYYSFFNGDRWLDCGYSYHPEDLAAIVDMLEASLTSTFTWEVDSTPVSPLDSSRIILMADMYIDSRGVKVPYSLRIEPAELFETEGNLT